MPKVSVIVPCYNVEKYIKECLDSIINQTLKDIEIICVDDGSTDSTGLIIDNYALKDSRFKVIHKSNSGYGASMNIGIDSANGEYIGIVEPDDFIDSNMYSELLTIAEKNNVDMVKCNWFNYYTSTNSSQVVHNIQERYNNKIVNIDSFVDILNKHPAIWAAIYNLNYIRENNIRFLETPGASYQDTSFSFKTLVLANNIYLLSKPYLYYRQDNESSSINSQKKVFALCDEYEEIDKFLEVHSEIKCKVEEMKWVKQFYSYKWNVERINEKYIDSFIKKFYDDFIIPYNNNVLQDTFFNMIDKEFFNLLITDKLKLKKVISRSKKKNKNKLISIRLNRREIKLTVKGRVLINVLLGVKNE